MSKEEQLIKLINSILPRSKAQVNQPFQTDAEVLEYNDSNLLVNIDDFSPEDRWREFDPYTLGWNIAVGAVSDILASGGQPQYYGHSLVVEENWDQKYITEFCRGLKEVLTEVGASFLGGDFGTAVVWHCTAVVIGKAEQPLFRTGAQSGDLIYLSGKAGLGNLEALLSMYSEKKSLQLIKNRFKLRWQEAKLIKEYATSCIDTSDGVAEAANTIAKQSGVGYAIEQIPYIKRGLLAAKLFSLPPLLLFLGGAGEYELLFTIPSEREKDFLTAAEERDLSFHKLGEVTESKQRLVKTKRSQVDLTEFNIAARDYDNLENYVDDLINFIKG